MWQLGQYAFSTIPHCKYKETIRNSNVAYCKTCAFTLFVFLFCTKCDFVRKFRKGDGALINLLFREDAHWITH